MNIGSRLTWVRPFLILVLVITVPLVVYWFGYVDGSIRAALRQFHTTVAAVATSLEGRLGALDQVARTAEGLPDEQERLAYLRSLVNASSARAADDRRHLTLAGDERGLLLSVSGPGKSIESVSVKLEDLIPWDIVEAEFDGLLVLSDTGRLLAQDRRLPSQPRGLPVHILRDGVPADLRGLFIEGGGDSQAGTARSASQSGTGAATASSAPPTQRDSRWRLPTDFAGIETVTLAGTRYLAFLQPVRLFTSPIGNPAERSGGLGHGTVDVLVAGLVAEDRMRRQSRSLSPQTLANVLAAVGLGLFLIPFLKLRFIGARERMRYRDVFTMAVALLGITAVVVLFIMDGSATATVRKGLDAGNAKLHLEISERIARESEAAIQQLEDFGGFTTFRSALGLAPEADAARGREQARLPQGTGNQGALLLRGDTIDYPALDTIFLANRAGQQTYKWNPRTIPTGTIAVGGRGYFRDALALATPGDAQAEPGHARTAREFVVSMTTGQEQMAFSLPVDGATGQMGVAVPPQMRSHVAVLTTPMRSLARTVVPSPYEFVLVGRDGRVTFRNAKSAYLGERFFEQVRGGAVLATVPRDGRTISDDFTYRWRNIHAVASDVPALQMTLVTYYDNETARELAARAFGTAVAFALAAMLSTVIGSLLATFVWGRQALDWLWPDSEDTGRYVVGIGVCVVAVLTLVAVRPLLPGPGWFAVGVLIIPGLVTVLCGSPLWFRTRLRWQLGDADTTPTLHKVAFCGFLLSLLLALVATPTVLAFDDSLRLYSAGFQRVSALQWWRDVERSARRFDAEYAEVQNVPASPPGIELCGPLGRICASSPHYATLAETLVDRSNLPITAAGAAEGPGREWDLYRTCPNPLARDEHRLVTDAPSFGHADCGRVHQSIGAQVPWSFTKRLSQPLARLGDAGPAFTRALAAGHVEIDAPVTPLSGWTRTGWTTLWILVGFALLVFITHSVAVHILGLGWRNQRLLDASARVEKGDGKRWLILRPTRACLERLKSGVTNVVDLRHAAASAQLVAPESGQTLVVLHLEVALTDEALRRSLLTLAATPAPGCLVLCSEIDPLYYLSQRVREAAETRFVPTVGEVAARDSLRALRVELQSLRADWAAALSDFQKARVHPPTFPTLDENLPRPIRALLYSECRHSEPLIAIAERLAQSPDLANHREDEIIGFVLDAAEPYYRSVWELCTDDERLLMVQLAEEGVINPKRFDVFRQLHHRGLVVVEPRFDLMNHSFRYFVRSVESPERVLEWEHTPAALGWKRFSTPLYTLAAVVIAILLYTQQDLFSQMLALATGAAGALNSLRSLGITARAHALPETRKTANA